MEPGSNFEVCDRAFDDVDLFTCDDLAAALAACAPALPTVRDRLPGAVLKTFRAGIDGCLLLEHAVPHRVVPQLLRPVVGPYVEPQSVELRHSADAAMCVGTIKADDDMFLPLASYARHLPHVTSVIDVTSNRSRFDLRAFIPSEVLSSVTKLVLAQSISTKSIRRLITFKQLTHLDVCHCTSLRPTALPYIAQLTNLEFLNIEGLRAGRRGMWRRPVTIPEGFANLAHLRVLKLGRHRLSSLAPLRHLSSLEELYLLSLSFPRRTLQHLAGLQHLHTLKIQGSAPCLIGIRQLEHLTTLFLRDRRDLTAAELDEVCSSCGLTSLALPAVDSGWGFDAIQRLGSTLTSLRTSTVSVDALVKVAPALPRLKILTVAVLRPSDDVTTLHQYTLLEHLTVFGRDVATVVPAVARIRQLQHLELTALKAIDALTIRPLVACKRLTHLSLRGRSCESDSFAVLREMSNLEVLHIDFGSKPFHDDVARHLGSMRRLREVRLRTSAEVTKLFRSALPWIAVH